MDAHMANETRYVLGNGLRDNTRSLIHIILPDGLLIRNGVLPNDIRAAASAENGRSFRCETQVRYHASGECATWSDVFSGYVTHGAVAGALIPNTADHRHVFPVKKDGGGLFVSLPLVTDDRGRYDPFTVVALRITLAYRKFRELFFTLDELVPNGTRYRADSTRLAALCRQFCAYVRALRGPAHLADICDGLEACLEGSAAAARPGEPVAPVDTEALITSGGLDNPELDERVDEEDREVMTLIKRAAEMLSKRRPVRAANDGGWGTRRGGVPPSGPAVASGLRQGAMSFGSADRSPFPTSSSTRGGSVSRGDRMDQAALFAGLEPPGSGRFVRGDATSSALNRGMSEKTDLTSILNDTLLLVPGSGTPSGPLEWLDAGCVLLSGGDSPSDAWRRRPISLVPRVHYASGERFVVISYDGSVAWGGRRVPENLRRIVSCTQAVAAACATDGVDNPRLLRRATRDGLVAEFPMLTPALADDHPVLAPFDVGSERDFAWRFQTACTRAVAAAVAERLQTNPRMHQLLSYDFQDAHREYVLAVTERAPELIEFLLASMDSVSHEEFSSGSVALAALAHLMTLSPTGYCPDEHNADVIGLADVSVFAFDYYSTGGEITRLSKRPILVVIDGGILGHRQCSCRFARLRSPLTGSASCTCEKFLPGESYAHLCVGFNRRLQMLVIFPGGFGFVTEAAPHFAWPHRAVEPLLDRFCRRVPTSGPGGARRRDV